METKTYCGMSERMGSVKQNIWRIKYQGNYRKIKGVIYSLTTSSAKRTYSKYIRKIHES